MATKNPEQNAKDQANIRQRRKDSGLVRVEVWVKPEHREKLKDYAKELQK